MYDTDIIETFEYIFTQVVIIIHHTEWTNIIHVGMCINL